MIHVLAVLGLAAALVLLFLLGRWAGVEERPGCAEAEPSCEGCALDPAHCGSAPAKGRPPALGSRRR